MTRYAHIGFNVSGAKASSSPYSVGIPAMTQISGFVDAIRYKAKRFKGNDTKITGWAIGYKNAHLHGVRVGYDKFAISSLKSSIEANDSSIAPIPKIDMSVHMILEIDGDSGDVRQLLDVIRQLFEENQLNFCGGRIDIRKSPIIRPIEDPSDIPSAFWILDGRASLAAVQQSNPDKTLLDCMAYLIYLPFDGVRYHPNTLGYVSLQDAPVVRHSIYDDTDESGATKGHPHIYAEPAVGVVFEEHTARLIKSINDSAMQMDATRISNPQYRAMHEQLSKIIYRKHFDARGSMYLSQIN